MRQLLLSLSMTDDHHEMFLHEILQHFSRRIVFFNRSHSVLYSLEIVSLKLKQEFF